MNAEHREFILSYLRGRSWTSPTEIGNAYGKSIKAHDPERYHSSWASPKCKRLVQEGLVERSSRGHYRLCG